MMKFLEQHPMIVIITVIIGISFPNIVSLVTVRLPGHK